MSGNASRQKGQRGHTKAREYLNDCGWIAAVWPHTRWNADAFGFADIIAFTKPCFDSDFWLIQVKNTKRKPCLPELRRFKDAVKNSGLPMEKASFMWFGPRSVEPQIWRACDIVDAA